jgi:hypothetical protein
VSRDFRSLFFFHQSTTPGAPIHGLKPFRIWLRIRRDNRKSPKSDPALLMIPWDPTFFQSSLLIFTFSINYMDSKWCLAIYLFLKWFPFKGKESQDSFPGRFLRCHKTRSLQNIISNISANTKPYAKRLLPINQGPKEDCLIKKNEGWKSRETVSWLMEIVEMWMGKEASVKVCDITVFKVYVYCTTCAKHQVCTMSRYFNNLRTDLAPVVWKSEFKSRYNRIIRIRNSRFYWIR